MAEGKSYYLCIACGNLFVVPLANVRVSSKSRPRPTGEKSS